LAPGVGLRRSTVADLPFITTLERLPENREHIGQWTDDEHRAAIDRVGGREHWIIERDGAKAGYLIAYDATDRAAGIYVKRILVADKERGTGTAALTCFLDDACAREGVEFVWLLVRDKNERGQAVYRKLGMRRYDPPAGEAARWDAAVDPAGEGVFRMRIEASAWRRSRAR
jgi:ribosomal protein S18 acetylase RimI-like enzyme